MVVGYGVLTRFVLKYTLRIAHLELGGVDLDLAVEDDVLPLDRADMTPQVWVEREVRRRAISRRSASRKLAIAHQAGAGDAGVGDRHGSVRNKRSF